MKPGNFESGHVAFDTTRQSSLAPAAIGAKEAPLLNSRHSFVTLYGVLALISAVALATPDVTHAQNAAAPKAQPSSLPMPPLNVQVVNTPLPVTGTVSVSNLGSSPLPVRDLDNPAFQPFMSALNVLISPGPSGTFVKIPFGDKVPAGKRLVIEHVSALIAVDAGQKVGGALGVTTNGQAVFHSFGFTFEGNGFNASNNDRFVTSQSLRLYADPETEIVASIDRNASSGVGQGNIIISGYLVDLP